MTADPSTTASIARCQLRRRGLYSKLKPGRGHSADEVRANQRIRLYGATVDLVAQRGFPGLTVRRLARTSGVSTRTFYDHFENVEECFVSTYRAVRCSAAQILGGDGGGGEPAERLRRGLRALLTQAASDPTPALLALVHAFDGGPALVGEVDRSVELLAAEVASVLHPEAPPGAPPLSYVAVVAGIEGTIRGKLRAGRHGELLEAADDLSDWALVVLSPNGAPGRTRMPKFQGASPWAGVGIRAADFGPAASTRSRSLAATANLALDEGYWNLTSARICEVAGVSRRQFGRQFGDVSEPFLDAIEALVVKTAKRAWNVGRDAADWREAITRLVETLCTGMAEEPRVSRLCLLEAFEPGGAALRRREALITTAAAELARLGPRPRSRAATEASVAAAIEVLRSATARDVVNLTNVVPDVAHALLAPYSLPAQTSPNDAVSC